jgi:hypothetical protein
MSVSFPPGSAAAKPAHIDSSHTRISSAYGGSTSPTPTVIAESPCQPSTIAPQSMDNTSPSRSTLSRRGMPCTTSSFTEVQMCAGKPR